MIKNRNGLHAVYDVPLDFDKDLWSSTPLKHVARINPDSISGNEREDWEIKYVDISSVSDIGEIEDVETMKLVDAPSRAKRKVQDGDVIVSTVRTYLRAIAHIEDPPSNLIVSTGFAVLRPDDSVHHRYFWRVLQAQPFIEWIVANSKGVSYPAINPTRLGDLVIPVPPIGEQIRIAEFLDQRVNHINELIEKSEVLIQLLEEKLESITTRVATKGLDENTELVDSGIPTIGKIPSNWEVIPNRGVFSERDNRSENGDGELLTVSHKTGVTPRSEKDVNMFEAESLDGYKIANSGDLVINTMWAWMGAAGISPRKGLVSPSYHVYKLDGDMLSEYADIVYRTSPYVAEMGRFSKGVWKSRLRLYPDEFLRMKTILPPKAEQKEIVSRIESEQMDYNATIQKISEFASLLKEKRQALITEAVTGELDISHIEESGEQ
jgi:type I restriction enzyme S subunit